VSSAPSGAPSTRRPSTIAPPTAEASPKGGGVALPGSPELFLIERDGDDLKVLGWRAGETELGVRQVIAGAMRGITEPRDFQSQLSPDGTILLVDVSPATFEAPNTFRAFRLDGTGGREIWESTGLGSGVHAGFVGPAQVIVTTGSQLPDGTGWTVVDLSADTAVVRELDVPIPPRPSPGASIDVETLTVNYVPMRMSADGRFLYVLSTHFIEPIYRPAARFVIQTGEFQPITEFPSTGPSRVTSAILAPHSGRLLLAGAHSTAASGLVEAWLPGATMPDFKTDLVNVFGAVWLDDGRVLTAAYDRLPSPFKFEIVILTAAGQPDATLFSADARSAALLGALNGFVVAYATPTGSDTRTLVMIRLADEKISTLDIPEPSWVNLSIGLRP
jgi:hypothetical protein